MNIKMGKTLFAIRKEANLSQQEIADLINCSRGTYSCWEHDAGEIPLSKLLVLLQFCKIPLSVFVKRIQEENELPSLVSEAANHNDAIDIKAELAFISNRIALLNQNIDHR